MAVENVAKFYNEVMKDDNLKNKLRDVNERTLTEDVFKNKVLPEAKAKGYDFTYDEVKSYYEKQNARTELSVDQLGNVSGGTADQSQIRKNVTCGDCKFFSRGLKRSGYIVCPKQRAGSGCNNGEVHVHSTCTRAQSCSTFEPK